MGRVMELTTCGGLRAETASMLTPLYRLELFVRLLFTVVTVMFLCYSQDRTKRYNPYP